MSFFDFLKKIFPPDQRKEYRIVGYVQHIIMWTDQDNREEELTYILMENGYGHRQLKSYSYGRARELNREKNNRTYIRLQIWANGGPMPESVNVVSSLPPLVNTQPALSKPNQITGTNIIPFKPSNNEKNNE